jgi:hypothetical protein
VSECVDDDAVDGDGEADCFDEAKINFDVSESFAWSLDFLGVLGR